MKLLIFLATISVAAAVTSIVRIVAVKCNIVNHPNKIVPQHIVPVAYLGGVAVWLSIAIVLSIGYWFGINVSNKACNFLLFSFGFLAIGAVDDFIEFKAITKFLFQLIAAIVVVLLLPTGPFFSSEFLDVGFKVMSILTMVNACNLTDVCDGLITSIATVILLGLGLYFQDTLMILLAGCLLGFYPFNAPNATIYMGDAGSHLVGFALAYFILLHIPTMPTLIEGFTLILTCAVFLFELLFLIVVRTSKGLKWWKGSPDHYSLRLQKIGFTKWNVLSVSLFGELLAFLPLISYAYFSAGLITIVVSIITLISYCLFGLYLIRVEYQ